MTTCHAKYAGVKRGLCLLAAVLIGGGGCAGYRLGSTLPPGINVVNVPSFVNETAEPQIEIETTQAVISEFQRDGTLSTGDAGKADVVLSVTLKSLTLVPLRYDGEAPTTTHEYRMTIRADLRLIEVRSGTVLTTASVIGETDFIPEGDLSTAKRTALPGAAEDLARRIVRAVVEFW